MLPRHFLLLPPKDDRHFLSLQRKSRLLLLRQFLHDPFTECSPKFHKQLTQFKKFLTVILKTLKKTVVTLIGHIDVSTLLRSAILRIDHPQQLLNTAIPIFLSLLPKTQESFVWDYPCSIYNKQAERIAYTGSGIDIQNETLKIEAFEIPSQHRFSNGIEFSLLDSNPISLVEAHPDKEGNAIDLADHPTAHWYAQIEKAIHHIQQALPTWSQALPCALQRIIPVGYHEQKHMSASYEHALGLCYISLHPSSFTIAEAIIHETQHNKLNTALWMDDIAHNASSQWTTSPIRPDLRPLKGVILAVHAFLPVAAFYVHHQKLHPALRHRLKDVMHNNDQALKTLKEKMAPTPLGKILLSEMCALHEALKKLMVDVV